MIVLKNAIFNHHAHHRPEWPATVGNEEFRPEDSNGRTATEPTPINNNNSNNNYIRCLAHALVEL